MGMSLWWTKNAENEALSASCSIETGAMPIVAIELTDPATKQTRVFSPIKDRPEVWEVSRSKILPARLRLSLYNAGKFANCEL